MRILRLSFALLFLFASCLPGMAASDSVTAPHLQVRLIVLPQGLNRGQTAQAGVYFKLEAIAVCVYAPRRFVVSSGAIAQTKNHGGWQPWSLNALGRNLSQGKPVFVDFTASWCLSCQVNERVALSRPEVRKAFADAGVILLRADWTRHDEAITQTLAGLGRSGVPTYVLYTPGQKSPHLLPEVLTPAIVTDALAKLPRTTESKQIPGITDPGTVSSGLTSALQGDESNRQAGF